MSVFTPISESELAAILADYDLGEPTSFAGVPEGIENTNYFLTTTRGRYVLTLFERVPNEDVPYFLQLMEHLAARGIPCPRPIPQRNGALWFSWRGKRGCIVQRLPGRTKAFLDERELRAAGALLARLHEAGRTFPQRRGDLQGLGWMQRTASSLAPWVKARFGTAAQRMLEEEMEAQTALALSSLPQGVVHGDLFADNLLFADAKLVGVIDLYYAHDDAWAYDLAIAANALAWVPEASRCAQRVEALVVGYEEVRALTPQEQALWPLLLRRAALRFWLSRLADMHAPRKGQMTTIKDPEEFRARLAFWRQQ